jgi:hypothetical protein
MKMNRLAIPLKQPKMEPSLQQALSQGTILRMNRYVRIAVGSLVVVAGLILSSCASDTDIPSAYGTDVPSAPNPEVSTGPASGEGDFAAHQ